MFFTMGVTLYTSRIILNTLGVEDFGIYSIVGGVVSLFSFFNAAMSSATQRYLSYDIGQSDESRLKETFNVTLIIHCIIALVLLMFAETIGLWYVNNKLNVNDERMIAVNWVYQFSIFTALIGVLQVPFNSLIIARERMNIFAVMSLLDVGLKLGVVYLLVYINYDKLILYSILVFIVSLMIAVSYRIYCNQHFVESKFQLYKNKSYYKELLNYSGWNLFGNIASVAKGQGINLLLNLFYGTLINAAYGITLQVQNAVNTFVNNFQLAVNPQIIKSYSKGDTIRTHTLILQSARFSFILMLMIIGPILLNTDFILHLWLKIPPPLTIVFVQLCLINVLIDCLSGSLMIGAQATGKIKWYQIIVGSLVFLNFPISFITLKIFNEAHLVFIVSIIISIISLQFRLYFIKKTMAFNVLRFYKEVILRIIIIGSLCILFYILMRKIYPPALDLTSFFYQSVIILFIILILVITIGITRSERNKLKRFIKF